MQGESHETLYQFVWQRKLSGQQKNINYKTLNRQKSLKKEG